MALSGYRLDRLLHCLPAVSCGALAVLESEVRELCVPVSRWSCRLAQLGMISSEAAALWSTAMLRTNRLARAPMVR